jgi:transposase-like protein
MPAPKSPEFRRRALDLVEQGEPVAQVARNLGISESCLRRWMAQAEVDAGRREGLTSSEKRELVELRRKNRVLEMENEILKRASAYFARENVLPK